MHCRRLLLVLLTLFFVSFLSFAFTNTAAADASCTSPKQFTAPILTEQVERFRGFNDNLLLFELHQLVGLEKTSRGMSLSQSPLTSKTEFVL